MIVAKPRKAPASGPVPYRHSDEGDTYRRCVPGGARRRRAGLSRSRCSPASCTACWGSRTCRCALYPGWRPRPAPRPPPRPPWPRDPGWRCRTFATCRHTGNCYKWRSVCEGLAGFMPGTPRTKLYLNSIGFKHRVVSLDANTTGILLISRARLTRDRL